MKTFITETNGKFVILQTYKSAVIIFAVLSMLSCLGFFVAWQTFVFLEIISLVACVAVALVKKRNGHDFILRFEGDQIYIKNKATLQEYEVFDISARDFVINQSREEAKLNYCSLLIKNTVFAFGGVKKHQELKKYIEENFK